MEWDVTRSGAPDRLCNCVASYIKNYYIIFIVSDCTSNAPCQMMAQGDFESGIIFALSWPQAAEISCPLLYRTMAV